MSSPTKSRPPLHVTCTAVVCWYASNMLVAFSNKALLSNYGLKYPLSLTLLHMTTCTLACIVMGALGRMWYFLRVEKFRTLAQLQKIALLAAVFCMSVTFGNISLRYIPVSFNQAISATTPAFTAVLTFILLSKVESLTTYLTLIPVVLGIVIASRFEPSFHMWGFTACLIGTSLRGLKTVVQSMLLSDSEKLPSLSLLAHMAPVSAALLLPVAVYSEPEAIPHGVRLASSSTWFIVLLSANCALSFFVNLTNFLVTKYCGALTVQVLGNAKGVVAAAVSVLIFHNPVSFLGWVGYGITMFGVVAYSESRKQKPKHAGHDTKKLLNENENEAIKK